jgi:predicted metal-dependent phosphotriesterase family hydrolase
VASTGFHKRYFYPEDFWAKKATVEKIARLFVSEIEQGAYSYDFAKPFSERSSVRAGVIKVATDKEGLDSYYTKVFSAAAIAHRKTGAPVLTHTELSTYGVQQARFLIERGVVPECIIISHMDRVIDIENNLQLARIGVFLDYDTIAREKYHSDEEEVALIKEMVTCGYGERIVLGMDTTRERLSAYGGAVGLDYVLTEFRNTLVRAKISEQTVQIMLTKNPQHVLTFAGREGMANA